ncbi:MAG: Gfo/Idh/MocA family oxidoreductase [Lachnospiraceae bacterium]|nr:Gfo/Idh/MocA family oxidoreductase [Lachnospiraceae bacterium]
MSENKVIRIGIVGCGGMGGGHAVALHSGTGNAIWNVKTGTVDAFDSEMTSNVREFLELAGTFDIKEERQEWARSFGIHTYDSYEEMLEDPSVDAILIATPNHLHKEQAIAALRAGKHVLCEKPVMLSAKDLRDVVAVAKETGRVFYPRQNREWDEDYLIIKKIYDEKLIGNVFNVKCRIMGSRGIPGDWRGIKACGGGMMLDWGVHIIDRMLQMVPAKVTRLYCTMTHITNDECDDGFQLLLTFADGMTCNLEVGTCHFVNEPLWCIYGDKGSAEIMNWKLDGRMVRLTSWEDKDVLPIVAGAGLTKTMAPRKAGESTEELPLPRFDYDRNALYRNFAETCRGTAAQIVTNEHAERVLRLMEAAFESDRLGEAVSFE